jgi:hypothetical protein
MRGGGAEDMSVVPCCELKIKRKRDNHDFATIMADTQDDGYGLYW